ncbi:Eukaryotic translation initiation factor 2A [Nosema granulosis]|uniref:Eukaryotic translation initiation factor 2A n=1 Tax=Nosema granulosis TaxID=83296 RepID=A0A9P6KYZ7_9MICR|nr:Eukaryotic translation initiation factor 2A [Nosema granulosis]
MAILAHIEGSIILDVFGNKKTIECDTYSISNNILMYTKGDKLVFYDLLEDKEGKTHHIFSKPSKLIQSTNGKIVGVLNEDYALLVFDQSSEMLMESEVSNFDLSNNLLTYVSNDKIVIRKFGSSSPFHRASNIYSKFYTFDDFVILATRKSIKDNNYKIFKIDEAGSVEIGCFDILEEFACRINKENTYILLRLATSYVKNSYFAHTELYLYDIKETKLEKIPKISNISDFKFIKDGFVIIFGSQPSNVCVYDYQMNRINRFPKGLRNQIYYNPHNNIVALAGFEQLSGDIEVYNAEDMQKYAELVELGANDIKWETDGAYFYVSTTKYLKEDNKITMFDYHGRRIKEEKYEALISSTVYGVEKDFISLPKPEASTKPRKQIYVPPHLAKNSNRVIKENKPPQKKAPQETLESLKETLKEIERLRQKLQSGEMLSTKEMNLLLKEDSIKNKIDKFVQ